MPDLPTPRDAVEAALLTECWDPVLSYADLCTAGSAEATRLAREAFARGVREARGSETALPHGTGRRPARLPRIPLLLTAVRATATSWETAGEGHGLDPELRRWLTSGDAARHTGPPPHRPLALRALRDLPEPDAALLWLAEVEALPLPVAARRLGLDPAAPPPNSIRRGACSATAACAPSSTRRPPPPAAATPACSTPSPAPRAPSPPRTCPSTSPAASTAPRPRPASGRTAAPCPPPSPAGCSAGAASPTWNAVAEPPRHGAAPAVPRPPSVTRRTAGPSSRASCATGSSPPPSSSPCWRSASPWRPSCTPPTTPPRPADRDRRQPAGRRRPPVPVRHTPARHPARPPGTRRHAPPDPAATTADSAPTATTREPDRPDTGPHPEPQGAATATTPTAPDPTRSGHPACRVTYTLANQWPDGFQATVTVRTDRALDDWHVGWTSPTGSG
ncbi:hypothetical protein SGLAM104S_07308 [Streptomyces glaucescens]